MTRVRTLLVRAFVAALVLLSLGASVVSADTGGSEGGAAQQWLLPEDPGLD